MQRFVCIVLFLTLFTSVKSQGDPGEEQRMQWWAEAKFGMFIHWGVYSQLAGVYRGYPMNKGDAAWIMNRCKIPVAEYRQYAQGFNPVKYDPEVWVRMARDAGMKYIIITAKHHDGFALFDTEASDWDVVDSTPYGKDLLKPLAKACKKYGLKLGFYYSQANDWTNPGGTAARRLMNEGWPSPDSVKIDQYTKEHEGHWDPLQETATFDQYIDSVAIPQVQELLSNYGEVAILWWDYPTQMKSYDGALKLQKLLSLQPQIITNDRLHPDIPGDIKTPEQLIPGQDEMRGEYWETCMTMNSSWGYKKYDYRWKSPKWLICSLIDIVSKGGNFLLNVGPKGNGEFPEESIDILNQIGSWIEVNGEAIYGTSASPFRDLLWGSCTRKEVNGNTILYFAIFSWPPDSRLEIPAFENEVISASLLSSGKQIEVKNTENVFIFNLTEQDPDQMVTIIKLEVKGYLKSYSDHQE